MLPIDEEDLVEALEKDRCRIPPPGFIICKKCNGMKHIKKFLLGEAYYWIECKRCNATGLISWLQNVFIERGNNGKNC